MNNKIFIFLFLAVVASCEAIEAQTISNQVKNNYSPGVVSQVFDIMVKTDINENDQIAIANLIHKRDSTVHRMLKLGASNAQVLEARQTFDDQITGQLDADEKYDRYVGTVKEKAKDKYTYSQFAIATRYKDSLALTTVQVTAIYAEIEALKQMKNQYYATNHKSLDTRAYESEHISQILTNSQYTTLLVYKNKTKAEAFAERDWVEIMERGLDSTFTKEIAVSELYNYYLARQCAYDKYQHDPIQQQAEVRELYSHRPIVLRTLQKARRAPLNNTLGG